MPEKGSSQHIDDIDDVAEMESDEELAAAVVEGGCEHSPQLQRILKLCELQLQNHGYFGGGKLWKMLCENESHKLQYEQRRPSDPAK